MNAPSSSSADPRWRGFNLLELFMAWPHSPAFEERDFALMAEFGFNFARIPMSYWNWSKPDRALWKQIDERQIERVDGAVNLGRKHGVHVNLNLHRLPGYCINDRQKEPLDLFEGEGQEEALEAACYHWAFLAKRYRGLSNAEVSFDLINEPPAITPAAYRKVVEALVSAIRHEDPDRLIVADGINVGRTPVPELKDLGLMQSGRGYEPFVVSHYKAGWVPDDAWKAWPSGPTWPATDAKGNIWNRETLREKVIRPWKEAEALGIRVHIGEWGAYNRTPHAVVLAWMRDLLELMQEAGLGWALWNLRGDFGPLNSGRTDVAYEDFRGMKLDRAMFDLLRSH